MPSDPQHASSSEVSAEELAAYGLGFSPVHTAEISVAVPEEPVRVRDSDPKGRSNRHGGYIDPRIVERTITKHLPKLRACYERESRRDPSLSGKVTVRFVIQPDGQVHEAKAIENSTGSEAAPACVFGVLRRIQFAPDPDRGEVSWVYPFLFKGTR
jgi:TonB family protein